MGLRLSNCSKLLFDFTRASRLFCLISFLLSEMAASLSTFRWRQSLKSRLLFVFSWWLVLVSGIDSQTGSHGLAARTFCLHMLARGLYSTALRCQFLGRVDRRLA